MSTEPQALVLDPGVARLLDLLRTTTASPDLHEAREQSRRIRLPLNAGGPEVHGQAVMIETDIGPFPARLFCPPGCRADVLILYLHGGGWTLLDLDTHDRLMREVACSAELALLGLGYPLAPEAPFPNAINAVAAVVEQVVTRGMHDLAPRAIILAGDSAGANLAVAAALVLRDRCSSAFNTLRGLWLAYGVFDSDFSRTSYARYGSPPLVLTRERMEFFWSCYCRWHTQRSDPLASPIRATLSGLPPVHLLVAQYDILHDENVAFAAALRSARVSCECEIVPGTAHAFLEAIALSPAIQQVVARSLARLLERVCNEERRP